MSGGSFDSSGSFPGAALLQGSTNNGQVVGTINYRGGIVTAAVSAADLERAEALLHRLPLEEIPEPGGLPVGSWMPIQRNALFVGRMADLRVLARAVKAGETAAVGQIAAATGLGGIGKTQLAAEFVHRYGRFFAGGVCWLSFAGPDAMPSEIARCGAAMALRPDFARLHQPEQLALVLSAWCSPLPRLLVFDNREEPELLERWRPPHGGCHVLLTSRRASWPASTGVAALPLGILAPAESLALIAKHRPDRTADDPDLAAIAAALGHLPLALHLTGSYLERYRHDPGGEPKVYLAALRRPDLLDHLSLTSGAPSPTGHEWQVANSAEPRQAEPR